MFFLSSVLLCINTKNVVASCQVFKISAIEMSAFIIFIMGQILLMLSKWKYIRKNSTAMSLYRNHDLGAQLISAVSWKNSLHPPIASPNWQKRAFIIYNVYFRFWGFPLRLHSEKIVFFMLSSQVVCRLSLICVLYVCVCRGEWCVPSSLWKASCSRGVSSCSPASPHSRLRMKRSDIFLLNMNISSFPP